VRGIFAFVLVIGAYNRVAIIILALKTRYHLLRWLKVSLV
jgi:hypothetical protein